MLAMPRLFITSYIRCLSSASFHDAIRSRRGRSALMSFRHVSLFPDAHGRERRDDYAREAIGDAPG